MAASPSLTLVLMGRTGNGKSATGNSILGKKAFKSQRSSSSITKSFELQTCVRQDGQVINVIDTPGMFGLSDGSTRYTAKEIVKCIDLASEGIHAVLLVFSVRAQFTQEEETTIQTLQNLFGPKIVDYAIVVLTGGDEFEDDDDAVKDYLTRECPVALKGILATCKNRCVVFDNKTKSESKKEEQVNELLDFVNEMIEQNGGQPFKTSLISNLKLEKEFNEVKSNHQQSYPKDLYSDPKLEEKLNETHFKASNKYQWQLEEEKEASHQAEERAQQIKIQSKDEIGNLRLAASPSLTLVLMGRTGNGKSATGNSILGKKAFKSQRSSSGITKSSELQRCVRQDGQVINVIDTPGMFDLSRGSTRYTAKEIVKCIDLASEGIHAILLVFSMRTRFTKEEEATIQTLQNSFGPKIVDYAIVVLTGGDEFEDDDAVEDYLSRECPVALKGILAACKNRRVVFDNKTKSESKKEEQVNELLDLVNEMIAQNGGQPYKPALISNLKLEKEFNEVKSKLQKSYTYSDPKLDEKLNEMLLKASNKNQQQLEEEKEASRQAKERAQQIQKQSEDEIRNLNEQIRTAVERPPPPVVVNVVQERRSKMCPIL